MKLAAAMNFKFPTMVSTSLHSIVTNASHDGIQLMADLLAWDPHKRPTATQVQNKSIASMVHNTGLMYNVASFIIVQALRSKYFLVGQNLNTNAQSTAVSRPNQPVAQITQHKLSAAQHQNHDHIQLGKASYKKNSSVSPQFNHVMKDISSSNVSTRRPTPGINESKALFESSLENFQTSKSNLMGQAGSKLDSETAAPPSDLDWNSKGFFGDSKPPVKGNKNEYDYSTNSSTKFPSLSHPPAPSWQQTGAAFTKPSNENKRTLYNPVSGKQRIAAKAHFASGVGEGNPTSYQQRTAAWARSKRESVEFEGLLADITLGQSGVGNARKQPEGYVLQLHFAICVEIYMKVQSIPNLTSYPGLPMFFNVLHETLKNMERPGYEAILKLEEAIPVSAQSCKRQSH